MWTIESPDRALVLSGASVSVCFPARNEERTIEQAIAPALMLQRLGLVEQVVVADLSDDATPRLAKELGAEVYRQDELQPQYGPVLGKGDAMWRSLSVLTGEIIVFLDADSELTGSHYISGLAGPIITGDASFVKGYYRRPFRDEQGRVSPDGGGRVTELCAKPLLRMFFPELAAVRQPLAGEIAGTRMLFDRLPFGCDYGVDVGLLIDAYNTVGLDRLAQVNLDVRQNAHQPLGDLGRMADEVLRAVMWRTASHMGDAREICVRPSLVAS